MDKVTAGVKAGLLSSVVAIVVGFIAITSQSLWIDEANSAVKAMAPDWASFVAAMRSERGSDLQMPLYMLILWAWEKLFGHSEFVLRAINIPLFALALALAATFWRTADTSRIFFVIFACSSAFLWAYLDEARPYILQFLGATMCVIPMASLAETNKPPQTSDITLFAAGVLLLCGSSLFGVVSAFWFCLAFLMLALQGQCMSVLLARKDLRIAIGITLPLLLLLGMYYWWTLALGAKASSVGKTGLLNVAHSFYELVGMAGLGPGRAELRASTDAIFPFIPILTLYACTLGLFIGGGLFTVRRWGKISHQRKSWLIFWLIPAVVTLSTFAVGVIGEFRVVGRHLAPLLPSLLILLSITAGTLWKGQLGIAGRVLTGTAILAMISSAVGYRILDRHAKDDYRHAAALARETISDGGVIWWAADRSAAHFYGLKTIVPDFVASVEASKDDAFMANSRDSAYFAALPEPSLVILSKVDVYDRGGSLRCWLAENQYELVARKPAFSFYKKLVDKL